MKEDRLLKWYALLLYLAVLLGVGAATGVTYVDTEGVQSLGFQKAQAIEAMLTTALILATFINVRIALSMAREAKEQRELQQKVQYDASAPVIVFDKYMVDDQSKVIVYCRNVGSEPVLDFLSWVTKSNSRLRGPYRYGNYPLTI